MDNINNNWKSPDQLVKEGHFVKIAAPMVRFSRFSFILMLIYVQFLLIFLDFHFVFFVIDGDVTLLIHQ